MKLDKDREIIEVARHTEQVTFQQSTRRTAQRLRPADARP